MAYVTALMTTVVTVSQTWRAYKEKLFKHNEEKQDKSYFRDMGKNVVAFETLHTAENV